MQLTDDRFIRIWQQSSGVTEVAECTGMTKGFCSGKASRLRKFGVAMKRMPFNRMRPIKERLLEKIVQQDGCWIWSGSKTPEGYGKLSAGRRGNYPLFAHRVAYEVLVGPIANGMKVLHTCDNPECCNPEHLFLGTMKDNTHDMMRKGRAKFGGKRQKPKNIASTFEQHLYGGIL